MNKSEFIQKYKEPLQAFSEMSQKAGSRSDFVQGGGGNTSVKLDDQLMAIKASGFRLDQITEATAYAVLDYQRIRSFYKHTSPQQINDIEAAGSAKTKTSIYTVTDLESLRPSVEAGFHAMLDRFVLHSHSVYANLAACSEQGRETAKQALAELEEPFVFVPYINPGAQLTFAIDRARQQEADEKGRLPAVLFMENHGLIITGDDEKYCLELHQKVNEKLAAAYQTSDRDWPSIQLEAIKADSKTLYLSQTDWLRKRIKHNDWNLELFMTQALYPDQLVFLTGQMAEVDKGSASAYLERAGSLPAKATLFRESGDIIYDCGKVEAKTMEETLCAIFFIHEKIKAASQVVRTMDEAGKEFIRNWESEKYRKQVAGKDTK